MREALFKSGMTAGYSKVFAILFIYLAGFFSEWFTTGHQRPP
jgi:hypothetical protein